MKLTHPACGVSWVQSGNRSGHCSGCCRTFSSLTAFDAHQYIEDGRRNVCVDPGTLLNKLHEPRFRTFVDKAGATVWRSAKALDKGVFA